MILKSQEVIDTVAINFPDEYGRSMSESFNDDILIRSKYIDNSQVYALYNKKGKQVLPFAFPLLCNPLDNHGYVSGLLPHTTKLSFHQLS